jgi:hypothetical protein
MDPNKTLAIMRQTIKEFREAFDAYEGADGADAAFRLMKARALVDLGDTLAESAGALDEWMTRGGFKPTSWEEEHAGSVDPY